MTWELDISRDRGQSWTTVAVKPSADACKSAARKIHANGTSVDCTVWYRLYGGDQLEKVSSENASWRMTWVQGNLRRRESQGAVLGGVLSAGAQAKAEKAIQLIRQHAENKAAELGSGVPLAANVTPVLARAPYVLTRADLASITAPESAFSTDRFLPKEADIPDEFWRGNGYTRIADALSFDHPMPDGELTFREGFTDDAAPADLNKCVRAHLKSYGSKHQHKIAGVGFMISQVCVFTDAAT